MGKALHVTLIFCLHCKSSVRTLYVLFEETHDQICIYGSKPGYSGTNQQKCTKVDGKDEGVSRLSAISYKEGEDWRLNWVLAVEVERSL